MIPKQYLGAFKAGHRKSAREFIDEELSYKLLEKVIRENCSESRKTLEYITKFNNEYYKNVIKKGDPNAIHNSDELRKDCYQRENSRNRDIYCCLNNSSTIDAFSKYLETLSEENSGEIAEF